MARILQIRRGTTQQNDNFTGMSGEVTFDTDAKTLRVHDGETLGGFKIARADQVTSSGATFDINNVSDDFWQELFSRFSPRIIKYTDSDIMPLYNGKHMEYIFNLTTPALAAQPILLCVNPDAGYAANDEVYSFGIGANTVMSPNLFMDNLGLHARLFIGGEQFWVPDNTTGIKTNVIPDNWRIKIRVYY